MPMIEVYSGSLSVAAEDYEDWFESEEGKAEKAEIEDLDVIVSERPVLVFTLDYPFEIPYEGKVAADDGITLREIIDAVRDGFRTMYRGASVSDLGQLQNKRVVGDHGEAVHVIDDIVIEFIGLDEEAGRLEIGIGS